MQIEFDTFISRLQARLKQPLPGSSAHDPLRATSLGTIKPDFRHTNPPRPGSVLILLYPVGKEIHFPLTQRAEYTGAHSGQISLPGGKAEPGEKIEDTALREGEEEIGIRLEQITVIGRLSEFLVIPSNFIVTPVVAYAPARPVFEPDPVEVVKVLEGSIDDLISEEAVQVKEITAARIYKLMAPHFLIEDQVVWGATAMILNELRMLIQDAIKS
jgi:8-oxo-dGTP pyrophosphatase MutT (NUDIX family)